jgi:adenylyl-sulfate kinase
MIQSTKSTSEIYAQSTFKRQVPLCIWLTGLSGAGKSSIAFALEKKLQLEGFSTAVLDGDQLRENICKDLGFSEADRAENVRRVAHISHLMVEAGLIVIVALISPKEIHRNYARSLFDDYQFIEVFVDTPLEVCEQRDPKGLYKKARLGEINNFTGVSDEYEIPKKPEILLNTLLLNFEVCIEQITQVINSYQK